MTDTLTINFLPNPVQRAFIESRSSADLFSSRMGEGKSAGLVWSTFYHTRHNPGARWGLIRDTWANLQATTLKEFFKWFPPGVMGTFNVTHKEWTWASGIADGTIQFLGMDDPGDASKLQSREWAGFGIDEPAPAQGSAGVAELVFDIAMSRLRQQGMNWYAAKLAENNPDEGHWTYRRFVDPGTDYTDEHGRRVKFSVWQPNVPENVKNLPPNYYGQLRTIWAHRPDLVRRFIEGKFGFQQEGKAVTPEWSDDLHLAIGLMPVRGTELKILWDFGLNPTCIITQVTPTRQWNVLDAMVGEDIGVEELCEAWAKPLLSTKYRGYSWSHIGDPAGMTREQSSSQQSAVRMLRKMLGGTFRPGPQKPLSARVDPLRAVLRQTVGTGAPGFRRGLLQVDRVNATPVWYALRGGWHHHVARTGLVTEEPSKNIHSHPGDAMGYGSAVLFPLVVKGPSSRLPNTTQPKMAAWSTQPTTGPLGFEQPGRRLPQEARQIGKS